ncbi:MAG: ABC transporter substrate-binding protein [Promethearchaeota archaeon]
MEMEKKNLAIIILAIVLAASGVGNIILGISAGTVRQPEKKNVLRDADAETSGPAVLDPADSWDSVSNDMIRHICDNLWYYDLYDPDFALEMRLAAEYPTWDATQTELTVILRENVYFHDGTLFNADAVKFTFDRIMYFTNWSGTLPDTSHVCDPSSLFFDMKGDPILNETIVNDDYNVTFVLNKPNGVFIPLLSYDACAILSPESTSATEYLTLGDDILVGTGPFEYVHYIPGEELKFKRFDMYWGPSTYWDEIIWVYYPDDLTANNAMLGGEVDYLGGPLTSLIATFQADPDIKFVNLNTSTIYRYWGINNHKINNTNVRKAIAYAYNYSYYIDIIRLGFMIRAEQFLPPGFPYYNASFKAPHHDTGIARQAMLAACADMGWDATGLTAEAVGVNPTNDAAWSAKTFATYMVLEHEGWTTGIEMNEAFRQDLDKIGISLVSDIMDWETYIWVSTHNEDRLELFHTGWGPDYLDPFNMIEPLLNNASSANHIQLNDQQILDWLTQYQETDPLDTATRANLLYKIQNRALNELYVELAVGNDMVMYVHDADLKEVCYNIQGNYWVRDCYYLNI